MTFTRDHQDLHVRLTQDKDGHIAEVALHQEGDLTYLNPFQLYALVDDVAVADPDEWSRRFDPRGPTELALRRVADYFRGRAKANREAAKWTVGGPGHGRLNTMADTFDLAVTRVMEEIEALYPNEVTDPTTAVNDSLNRRQR